MKTLYAITYPKLVVGAAHVTTMFALKFIVVGMAICPGIPVA
jgi:hypothetical protein